MFTKYSRSLLIRSSSNGKIRTGLIVSGPEEHGSSALFTYIMESVNAQERALLVTVASSQSLNLKTLLKYIIQESKSQAVAFDEELTPEEDHVRPSPHRSWMPCL